MTLTTSPARARGDGGYVGGIEVLPFGLLVFLVGALLVANAWAVVDARLAAGSAAREAARTYVETVEGDAGEATAAARIAAVDALTGHGRNVDDMGFTISPAGAVARCQRVDVTVSYRIRAVTVPFVGGLGDATVSVTHSEIIDPFRDNVANAGGSPCT
jgi:hypothetical protein